MYQLEIGDDIKFLKLTSDDDDSFETLYRINTGMQSHLHGSKLVNIALEIPGQSRNKRLQCHDKVQPSVNFIASLVS